MKRSATLVAVTATVVLANGCPDPGPARFSGEQAKDSLCVHLMGASGLAFASMSEDADPSKFLSALEVDVALLQEAGEEETAAIAADLIEDIRNRGSQPLKVSLFLLPNVDEVTRDAISTRLKEEPGVASYEFVSSEQAYDEFVKEYEDKPEFYEDLPPDALPVSFRITTQEGTDADELAQRLDELAGVDEVRAEGQLAGIFEAMRAASEACDIQLPSDLST